MSWRFGAPRSWYRWLLPIGFPLAIAACETNVSAIHDPLYQAAPHTSTIEASATNTRVGIDRITITVVTGEMVECTALGLPPTVIPCRRNATTVTHVCNYAGNPSNATCTYAQALGNQRMVTYRVEAQPAMGSSRSTPEITYAAGFPPTAGIARPVWWHRGDPAAGKIDVGFYPDADYQGLYTEFTNDVETIATGAFFNGGQNFAQDYTLFRHNVNLWAAPFGSDAQGCSRTFDPVVTPIVAETDGEAIVHKADFRDCAAIALGGGGSVWAKAGDPDWIFVHESGHFLHGQGDEYCCDGGYASVGGCANIFSSQAACQTAAPGHGSDAADCVQIGATGAWRNDNGGLETMEDRTDDSDWQDDSSFCVIQRFVNCGGGSCY
jgi:hypothetical protein